jgi:septal ring factor EnvC (AmiA/AmiB activator)
MLSLSVPALGGVALAADIVGADPLPRIQQQIDKIKTDESAERRRVERDERLIRELEQQLQQFESRNAALISHTRALEVTNDKLKADTTQRLQNIQEQVAKGSRTSSSALL